MRQNTAIGCRISRTVITDVTGVGFKLEARSDVLANPEDPHTGPVFQLKGKSDKFLLKFRKPK